MPIRWNNADLSIRARFMPEKLFLVATIDVWLDQRRILSTGGKLKLQGTCVERFDHLGAQHQVRLEWQKFLLHYVPCSLFVDNLLIATETIRIDNRAMNVVGLILAYAFAVALGLSIALGLSVLLRISQLS